MHPDTPIAFIAFNRPDHTRMSFSRIREQRPRQLFLIADGPRAGHPTDAERCAEVRRIIEAVDWPCDVRRDYSSTNLGSKSRVSSGLDWVFSQRDRAIVLEDDCVPHPDFFTFCEALLDRYADDSRVAVITGGNYQQGNRRGDASYYFSRYNHVWGWATWRRAWDLYDGDMSFWPEFKESGEWERLFPDPLERRYWTRVFDRAGQIDAWGYPWTASVWHHGGLTATPNVNLVSNIGFGPGAVHTTDASSPLAAMPVEPLGPLVFPSDVIRDAEADRYTFDHAFGGASLRQRRTPWGFVWWLGRAVLNRARGAVRGANSGR